MLVTSDTRTTAITKSANPLGKLHAAIARGTGIASILAGLSISNALPRAAAVSDLEAPDVPLVQHQNGSERNAEKAALLKTFLSIEERLKRFRLTHVEATGPIVYPDLQGVRQQLKEHQEALQKQDYGLADLTFRAIKWKVDDINIELSEFERHEAVIEKLSAAVGKAKESSRKFSRAANTELDIAEEKLSECVVLYRRADPSYWRPLMEADYALMSAHHFTARETSRVRMKMAYTTLCVLNSVILTAVLLGRGRNE